MLACREHRWRHAGCDECDLLNVRSVPTGTLLDLRDQYRSRGAEDAPDEHPLKVPGLRMPPVRSAAEILDDVIRMCRGEVRADD